MIRLATASLDPADVPEADPEDLARLMQILIRRGDGLMLLRGADDEVLRAVEAEFCAARTVRSNEMIAAIIRFRAVVDAFSARRLQALLMREGLTLLETVFHIAARVRLNAARGFSPQGLLWGIAAELQRARLVSPERGRGQAAAHRRPARTAELRSSEPVPPGTAPQRPAA